MLTDSQFNEVQQRLVSAWHRGDLSGAFAEIDGVLREGTREMKGQCLAYRGMIRESQGSLDTAKSDWLDALQYCPEPTFLRYDLEHRVGDACEKSGEAEKALGWYRSALRTCSIAHKFSGHRTLAAFLRLGGDTAYPDDTALLASVIQASWQVLEVPGEPDLINVVATVTALNTRFNVIISEASAEGEPFD